MSLWLQHILCVIAFIGLTGFVIVRTRRLRDPASIRMVELTIVALGAIVSIIVVIWWLQPARFTIQESLPLQLCDLVGFIAPLALLTRARWLRTLLHFWGFGLCSQWVFTPVSQTGPSTAAFWISFILHAAILGTGWFDYFSGGYRATWRDCRFAIGAGVVYLLAMLAINALLGSNYGYVGSTTPDAWTLVEILGPWPLRIFWISLLATGALVLVMLINLALNRLWPSMQPSVLRPQF